MTAPLPPGWAWSELRWIDGEPALIGVADCRESCWRSLGPRPTIEGLREAVALMPPPGPCAECEGAQW